MRPSFLLPLSFVLLAPAVAAPLPESALVLIAPQDRDPVLDLPSAAREALARRDWSAAVVAVGAMDPSKLPGSSRADHAFLLAWALSHSGRPDQAAALLPLAEETLAPRAYLDLLRAEVLVATHDEVGALPFFDAVPEDSGVWARARIGKAEALRTLDRTAEGFAEYTALASRPDPSPGSEVALLALGRRAGAASLEGKALLRRVYIAWPSTAEAREAVKLLGAAPSLNPNELTRRAEIRMEGGDYAGALADTAGLVAAPPSGEAGCRLRLVRGRSAYKLNQLTNAATGFGEVGKDCVDAEGDYGAPGLYLQGQAEFRKGRMAESARRFDQLASLYPKHSMADDGLTRAGIALQEMGDLEGAMSRWSRALNLYPEADTVPESTWRLAFAQYLAGDTDSAVTTAESLAALPPGTDTVLVQAGAYWSARWRAWPDVKAPNTLDEGGRQEAIEGFRGLLEDTPYSFYALLAAGRLAELAPSEAESLSRAKDHDAGIEPRALAVRQSVLDDPAIRDGTALLRLGLVREARAEWQRTDLSALSPEERAWLTDLRINAGDWLLAHDDFRQYIKGHPIETFGPNGAAIVRIAYPDRYWNEVQEATKGFSWDARMYHALVREESNFNKDIVSFAGAVGLGQLMPATAKQVAGWLSIPVGDLKNPENNLRMGAVYFDRVLSEQGGSPFLALAAYNAGGGRVDEWIERYGNLPTDEFVERIPFKETREYVKRVLGTWQTMHWQFDEGAPVADLSAYTFQALP